MKVQEHSPRTLSCLSRKLYLFITWLCLWNLEKVSLLWFFLAGSTWICLNTLEFSLIYLTCLIYLISKQNLVYCLCGGIFYDSKQFFRGFLCRIFHFQPFQGCTFSFTSFCSLNFWISPKNRTKENHTFSFIVSFSCLNIVCVFYCIMLLFTAKKHFLFAFYDQK